MSETTIILTTIAQVLGHLKDVKNCDISERTFFYWVKVFPIKRLSRPNETIRVRAADLDQWYKERVKN